MSRPTPQGISRQELVPERMTGEVVSNAGPTRSPSPAPVAPATHPPDTPMPAVPKSKTQLGLTLTACLSAACAGGPQSVPMQTPCPKGSQEGMAKLGWNKKERNDAQLMNDKSGKTTDFGYFQTRNGMIYARLLQTWGMAKHATLLKGEMLLSNDYVIGRFYEVDLEDGRTVPVCLEFKESMEDNFKVNGGSPTRPRMTTRVRAYVKERFNLQDPAQFF